MVSNLRLGLLLLVLVAAPVALGADWPHWRGPSRDGRAPATDLFSKPFGLERVWKTQLGPAYSGIVVSGGHVVTMFSDGEQDQLVALDADTGREQWRYAIGPTYKGHDGSEDGPLSTPTAHDGVAYGIGPKGKLFAVRLDDGSEVWSIDVKQRFDAREPEYGFTSTPLVDGDLLIVQVGGSDERALVGLDRLTGKTRWTALRLLVEYQSPSVLTLAGRRQVVAMDKNNLFGVDPTSGEVLWKHDHRGSGSSSSPHVTPLGGGRFLVKFWSAIALFELERAEQGFTVKKLYDTGVLSKSYQSPVHKDGYLYGFTSSFLTCVDAATGEIVWRSRPPGGKGLLLVDDHLVILGAKGFVVVAEATPEGYSEKARVQALARSGFTWPSLADGTIFVRNMTEIAAVRITDTPAQEVADKATVPPKGAFAGFLRRVAGAADRRAVVDAFLQEQERFPIVEDRRWIHFVYRGKAEDVAILGSMLDTRAAESLERVEGTDLFYKTYELEPDAAWEYRFQVDFEGKITDPLNPVVVPDWWEGEWSVAAMPDHAMPDHLDDVEEARRGRVVTISHASKAARNRRLVKVYTPPGYRASEAPYPLLVVNEGLGWVDDGRMVQTLDNLVGRSVEPLVVAFVARAERDWWHELGRGKSPQYAAMLAEELFPMLNSRFRIRDAPSQRALMGTLDSARVSVYTAMKYPDVFGKVAVRSMSLEGDQGRELAELLAGRVHPKLELYVDWNRYERRSEGEGYDRRADSVRFVKALESQGYRYTGGERADSSGWGSLRAGNRDMLQALFPAP